MRKLILGIAVVICLDLAFILAMMGEVESFEMAKAVESPIVNPIMMARQLDVPQITAEGETTVADDEAEESKTGRLPIAMVLEPNWRHENARKAQRRHLRTIAANKPAVKFQDTIIWIDRRGTYALETPVAKVERAETVRPVSVRTTETTQLAQRKRSFFERAAPVVKKPYDWLKAFASKLK